MREFLSVKDFHRCLKFKMQIFRDQPMNLSRTDGSAVLPSTWRVVCYQVPSLFLLFLAPSTPTLISGLSTLTSLT